MNPLSDSHSFSKLRSLLFPVHKHEMIKFMPMLIMLFLICFNYSILHTMKDSLVVTASGAEVIPFIKVWVMLPTAVLVTYIFTKLCNHYSQETVFYLMISGFLSFFALFAFILYPARDCLHPHAFAATLSEILPSGCQGLIGMLRYWTFTGFYVMCELWGSAILTVLFWGFANEVTSLEQSRRFYALFSIGLNMAAVVAGQVGVYFGHESEINEKLPFSGGTDAWEQAMLILISIVIINGCIAMFIFHWMNKRLQKDPQFDGLHHSISNVKKEKSKLSVKESFSYISNSKYLLCIAVIVVSYNLVINLVEVVWKDQLRHVYTSPGEFYTYMANLTTAIGVLSTLGALFMGLLLRRIGWTGTALITPVTMLITCCGFFSFLLFHGNVGEVVEVVTGTTPLAIAVFFGTAQNCLSKAAKYSVFDTTKEMAFIPLSHECKLKGKAAIDGVGSRMGKSGGSLIHQGLLMFFGSLAASASVVGLFIMVVIVLWIMAARTLGLQFNDLVDTQEKKREETAVDLQPTVAATAR